MDNRHPLYIKIYQIYSRCYNPKHDNYKYYGGRGITVCDEWRNNNRAFVVWGLANGWRPGLEIDRIDNDKGYSPDNCHFVTRQQNVRNSSASKLTDGMIREIKRLLGLKVLTHEHIAFLFKVHRSTITRINCGLRHANV